MSESISTSKHPMVSLRDIWNSVRQARTDSQTATHRQRGRQIDSACVLIQAHCLPRVRVVICAVCVSVCVRVYVCVCPTGSNKVVILWNLELESLRGDLGLPAFPPKSIHYEFLSYFRPVFFLRTRDYSKSVPVPPYLVNYSGALFREYPGPWQVGLSCMAADSV